MPRITELTISIYEAADGGFMYDIYKNKDLAAIAESPSHSDDGGLCTTSITNALGMAVSQAQDLIKKN